MKSSNPDLGRDRDAINPLAPSIDAIIADLAGRQARLSALIDSLLDGAGASPAEITRLLSLHGQNAARLGRLLRDRQALDGQGLDELASAVNRALDDLGQELDIDL